MLDRFRVWLRDLASAATGTWLDELVGLQAMVEEQPPLLRIAIDRGSREARVGQGTADARSSSPRSGTWARVRERVGHADATHAERPKSDAARVRTMVPLADVVRATELLQRMHDDREMDGHSCNCTDVAVFLHNKGNAEDRTEALLVLAPLAERLYDRIAETESKDCQRVALQGTRCVKGWNL